MKPIEALLPIAIAVVFYWLGVNSTELHASHVPDVIVGFTGVGPDMRADKDIYAKVDNLVAMIRHDTAHTR